MSAGLPLRLPELPETIYKYRAVDEHTLKQITTGEIFLSSARHFNDPFDTAIGYSYKATPFQVEQWTRQQVKRDQPWRDRTDARREARLKAREIMAGGKPRFSKTEAILQEQSYRDFGIFCASAVSDDLLMWAHYAANHTGVCLGLNRDVIDLEAWRMFASRRIVTAYKVEYMEEAVRLPFFRSYTPEELRVMYSRLLAVKSIHWEYEQEYRLACWYGADTVMACGPNLVSEVILGCRISDEDADRVLDALDSVGSTAQVYQARKHESRFELVLDPVE